MIFFPCKVTVQVAGPAMSPRTMIGDSGKSRNPEGFRAFLAADGTNALTGVTCLPARTRPQIVQRCLCKIR